MTSAMPVQCSTNCGIRPTGSLRVAVPIPRGKTGGPALCRRSLPPVFPRGVGTATRRLANWQLVTV